jgi:hypothetical protein
LNLGFRPLGGLFVRHEVFEHVKYFDNKSDSFDMVENVGRKFLATKIVELVEKKLTIAEWERQQRMKGSTP